MSENCRITTPSTTRSSSLGVYPVLCRRVVSSIPGYHPGRSSSRWIACSTTPVPVRCTGSRFSRQQSAQCSRGGPRRSSYSRPTLRFLPQRPQHHFPDQNNSRREKCPVRPKLRSRRAPKASARVSVRKIDVLAVTGGARSVQLPSRIHSHGTPEMLPAVLREIPHPHATAG
jgi:hypothetical protein